MPTVYISPTGAGNKSGVDMANAATIGNLNAMIKAAGPDGKVALIADQGAYKVSSALNISAGGINGSPVTVTGVDSKGAAKEAVFEGTRPSVYKAGNPSGNELFKFQLGAGNLRFEHIEANDTGTVFRAAADITNLTIQHVDAHNVARFFEDLAGSGNATAKITGMTIRDVDVIGFSKSVVRLQDGSSKVLIEDVRGDSQRQDGDNYAIGVHVQDGAHDITIRRTTMANAHDSEGGGYWNGDGFATERGTYDIRFEDTIARGNTDAGYDLKSSSTVLLRALADDNTRNFRIWGDATMTDSIGTNPHKRGGSASQAQVWVAEGGKLTIKGGHFTDHDAATTVFINGGSTSVSNVDVDLASTARLWGGNALIGKVNVDLLAPLKAIVPHSLVPAIMADAFEAPVGAAQVFDAAPHEAPALHHYLYSMTDAQIL